VSSYGHDGHTTLSVNASFYAKTVVEDLRNDRTPLREDRLDGAGRHQRHLHQHRQGRVSAEHPHVRGYRGAADVFLAQQRNRARRPGRRPRLR